MKKQVKKMMLSKETLKRLESHDLAVIVGGTVSASQTCDSCGARFCVDEPLC
jgi:uridylate kinase